VIEKLNKEFVNTWVLRHDVFNYAGPDAAKKALGPLPPPNTAKRGAVPDDVRSFSKLVSEHYTYPVDSLVFDADGKFVADLSADEVFKFFPIEVTYLELLGKATRGAGK
jgi:hypothetical protein